MTDLCGVDSCRYVLLSKKLKCPSCLEKHVAFQSLHVFLLSNPEEMSSHCCPTQRDQYNWYIIDQFLLVLGFRGIQSSNLHHPDTTILRQQIASWRELSWRNGVTPFVSGQPGEWLWNVWRIRNIRNVQKWSSIEVIHVVPHIDVWGVCF